MQAGAGLAHGLDGPGKILGVVHRIVHAEDRDARLGGAIDEAANQVLLDRLRADEEPAAQRHAERRVRGAAAQIADALPGALDAALHRAVEAATAGHLKHVEARGIEQLADLKLERGGHTAGDLLLRENAQRGVDETCHQLKRLAAGQPGALGARDVLGLARVDTDAVALVHKQRHLHDCAGLERGGLHHV